MMDISLPVKEGMPVWPGSTGIHTDWTLRLERGNPSNLTRLDMDIHAGTHIEGALHSFDGDGFGDSIPLERFIGTAVIASFLDADAITATHLQSLTLPSGTTRVLLRTRNSNLWEQGVSLFRKDFVGLTPDGARWVVDHGIELIGNDYLSIARYADGKEVHEILLAADVAILEGIVLAGVSDGAYHLVCLPLKLFQREGAPARAVLFPL